MVGLEVEGREVVVVVLDLRPLGDAEAHGDEEVDDLVLDEAEWMRVAAGAAAAGKRDVDPLVGKAVGEPLGGEPLAGPGDGRLDRLLRLVDERAESRLFDIPLARAAALMRTIQSDRRSRLRCLRSR